MRRECRISYSLPWESMARGEGWPGGGEVAVVESGGSALIVGVSWKTWLPHCYSAANKYTHARAARLKLASPGVPPHTTSAPGHRQPRLYLLMVRASKSENKESIGENGVWFKVQWRETMADMRAEVIPLPRSQAPLPTLSLDSGATLRSTVDYAKRWMPGAGAISGGDVRSVYINSQGAPGCSQGAAALNWARPLTVAGNAAPRPPAQRSRSAAEGVVESPALLAGLLQRPPGPGALHPPPAFTHPLPRVHRDAPGCLRCRSSARRTITEYYCSSYSAHRPCALGLVGDAAVPHPPKHSVHPLTHVGL